MGPRHDTNAVVDDALRVHGIKGFVIDASIMPTITSGNTNAPTVMIAERGAIYSTRLWSQPIIDKRPEAVSLVGQGPQPIRKAVVTRVTLCAPAQTHHDRLLRGEDHYCLPRLPVNP